MQPTLQGQEAGDLRIVYCTTLVTRVIIALQRRNLNQITVRVKTNASTAVCVVTGDLRDGPVI